MSVAALVLSVFSTLLGLYLFKGRMAGSSSKPQTGIKMDSDDEGEELKVEELKVV